MMYTIKWGVRFFWLLFIFCLGGNGAVFAQSPGCTTSTPLSPISFGSVSSLAISTTQKTASQTNAGLRCGGSLITVLGSDAYIRANVTTTNNAQLKNGTYAIPYTLYADPSYSRQITLGTNYNYYNATLLNILGLGGTAYAPVPMYFRTSLGSYNLPAGTYTDTVTVHWSWYVCQGISILGLCIPIPLPNTGTAQTTFTLNLVITSDCLINAPNVNFGTAPLITSFNPVTQTITMTCTRNATYTISLSNGQNASAGQRRLVSGSNYMNYEIYQGASGTTRWGSTAGQTRSSGTAETNPGPATGSSAQGFVYRAAILPGQPTPPAGTYRDTILVNVTF